MWWTNPNRHRWLLPHRRQSHYCAVQTHHKALGLRSGAADAPLLRAQWVATALWERHGIRTLRRSLAELAGGAELGAGGDLRVGGARIAVVYFRAGYSPDDYPTEAEWRARSVPFTLQASHPYPTPSTGHV